MGLGMRATEFRAQLGREKRRVRVVTGSLRPQAPARRKGEMARGDARDQDGCLGTSEGSPGRELPLLGRLYSQPHTEMLPFGCLLPPVSKGSRLCLFVMHSAGIHKQTDINLCQPFLFKNMNYSRNITILIRNH